MRAQERLVGLAFIVEGTGFRAAAVRCVTVGITLLARAPFALQIVPSSAAACDWITEQLTIVGVDTPAALATKVRQIRSSPI